MNNRRQELYGRIRASSKDAVIREEMVRLGFWDADAGDGKMADEWLTQRTELAKEINQLAARQRKYENREAMLKEMRSRRMAEAKLRREETKKKRELERAEKAAAWEETRQKDIVYLGEGVSGGLRETDSAVPISPEKFGLPKANTISELAEVLETKVSELRFLAFHREVSKVSHYRRFFMSKKSGGQRIISAPMPRMKEMQYRILHRYLHRIPIHDSAHGFAPGRSILTNASQHVGQDIVINLDLKDFFPTVSYRRVKGLFSSLGLSEKVSTVLGLICTEPEADEVELDGQKYFVHTSERHLPQGAPTSPAVTNILCYRLDRRLSGMAEKLGFTYTRYADDMTFSASGDAVAMHRKLLWRVRSIVNDEGFVVHPEKTRIMRRGRQQEVTGLTVNDKVSVPRREIRKFRALLHQLEHDGPAGKTWRGTSRCLLSGVRGYAFFLRMIDPEKGDGYVERVEGILRKQNWKHEIRHHPKPEVKPPPIPKTKSEQSLLEKLMFWKR